jgi:hypothetical protein
MRATSMPLRCWARSTFGGRRESLVPVAEAAGRATVSGNRRRCVCETVAVASLFTGTRACGRHVIGGGRDRMSPLRNAGL